MAPFTATQPVFADEYDRKISALQSQIDQYDAAAGKLRNQRLTYEGQLAKLTNQKNRIQAQLDLSVAKEKKLEHEIELNQKKLDDNKSVLGDTIADLYIDDNISPLEMLASSDNIADYVDKQANRNQVKETVQRAIKEINELKAKLEKQKKEVELVITDQKRQRNALVTKEAEKQQLISATQGKESAFKRLIKQQSAQVSKLRAQQAAAMASGGGPGRWATSSSYPWSGKSMNYNDYCVYPNGSSGSDPWGYCYRQCTSYVAWKLATDGRGNTNFSGMGNASSWGGSIVGGPGDVRAGDVIIWYVGYYGHVMYIDSVSGGSANFSEFNANPAWGGTPSSGQISLSELFSGPYSVRRFH